MRIVVALLVLYSSTVQAQVEREKVEEIKDSTLIMNEVVVTAARMPTIGLNTPEALSVARSDELAFRQLRSAPEALSMTTGVFTQKTNHGGGSPFVRGLTGNQTLLLIDGIRLSNATARYGPNQYLNTIDLFSIDRMEVLRGNGSVQYGSDAIGGVIQVFTQDPEFSDAFEWHGRAGTRLATSAMEKSYFGILTLHNEKLALRGSLSWRGFGDVLGGDTTGIQDPTGYNELDYDVKARILVDRNSTLTIALQQVNQMQVPLYHKVALENYEYNLFDPQRRKLWYARYQHDFRSQVLQNVNITTSRQLSEEGRIMKKIGANTSREEFDRVQSLSFNAELATKFGSFVKGTSGFEIYHDLVNSQRVNRDLLLMADDSVRGLYPDGASMWSMALYTMHQAEWNQWVVHAGLRYNSFIINVEDADLGQARLTPDALVGSAAIMRKLGRSWRMFVSANTGFRAPNIDDLGTLGIVDFRYEVPNFDLKPEKSFQYQAGFKYGDARWQAELALYRNELYDLIVRTKVDGEEMEGYQVYKKENVERSYIQGLESSLRWAPYPHFFVTGNLTYTYGQNLTRGEPVRRIPPLFGSLSLQWNKGSWLAGVDWLAAAAQTRLASGDLDDNRIPKGGTPGWNVFNVNAGWHRKFIEVRLSLLNLLNKDYRYHGSGINGYGRSALLGITFQI